MAENQPIYTRLRDIWESLPPRLRSTFLGLFVPLIIIVACVGLVALVTHGLPKSAGAEDWFVLGNSAYDKSDWHTALNDYTQALAVDPNHSGALNNRGIVEGKLGMYREGVADFTKLIELQPDNNQDAYVARASYYVEMGKWTDALADYNHLVELNPTYPPYFRQRGAVYMSLGDKPHALADYNKAIDLDPKYPLAFFNRGQWYLDQNDATHALDDLNHAIDYDPVNIPEAYYLRATILDSQRNAKDAMRDYQEFLKLYTKRDALTDKALARLKALGQTLPQG